MIAECAILQAAQALEWFGLSFLFKHIFSICLNTLGYLAIITKYNKRFKLQTSLCVQCHS